MTRDEAIKAERDARAKIEHIDRPDREGWVCVDGTPDDDCINEPAVVLWRDSPENAAPLCRWHADERVHDAIPHGFNCTKCGVWHSALWPSGEPAVAAGAEL